MIEENYLPSVLWRCWLHGRKVIRPVKNWAVGYWHGYLSGARCRLAYGPSDATASHCLLHNTHTHPFNGPLSGTTRVSRYQKGKTNLDFTEARDSEWQWHLLGYMQVCTLLQSDNHASTPPLNFLQAGCPSCRPANSVKALSLAQASVKSTLVSPFWYLFTQVVPE